MSFHRTYRWRLVLTLFLLVVFGVTEVAESGLFGRCRLRMRRCRPATCQPACEPSCCTPSEPAEARAAMATDCSTQMCPTHIVMEYTNPMTGECAFRVYRCHRCAANDYVFWTGNCSYGKDKNCVTCEGCIPLPNTARIEFPSPPPSESNDDLPFFVSPDLLNHGLLINGVLTPGQDYEIEEESIDGVKKKGKLIDMPLLNDKQEPTGETRRVLLDWFKPKVDGPRESVGVGVESTEEPPENLDFDHKRISEFVYTLVLKPKDDDKEAKPRHYTIFLKGNQQ